MYNTVLPLELSVVHFFCRIVQRVQVKCAESNTFLELVQIQMTDVKSILLSYYHKSAELRANFPTIVKKRSGQAIENNIDSSASRPVQKIIKER